MAEGNGPEARRCRFCGLTHDPTHGAAEPVVHRIHVSTGRARPLRWILAGVLLVTVASLVPMIVGLYAGWRAVNDAGGAVAGLAGPEKGETSARPRRPARLVPADLRRAAAGVHELDAAPPSGGYSAVDPVAALPWALTLAQGWETDARLERIDVTRMRPDGTLNVVDDQDAVLRYRFRSPGRLASLAEQARLTGSARAATSLFVSVERGGLKAQVIEAGATELRRGEVPPHPAVLPLPKLVAIERVQRLLAGVPYASGYLVHIGDEGWVWYFSTLAGESKPRVRARDGAVWPYRPGR